MEPIRPWRFVSPETEGLMQVDRESQVMNVEVVGEAYLIASHYLCRGGMIPDSFTTNEELLGIIVRLFRRGERNKIRLANKAIAEFEARRAELEKAAAAKLAAAEKVLAKEDFQHLRLQILLAKKDYTAVVKSAGQTWGPLASPKPSDSRLAAMRLNEIAWRMAVSSV